MLSLHSVIQVLKSFFHQVDNQANIQSSGHPKRNIMFKISNLLVVSMLSVLLVACGGGGGDDGGNNPPPTPPPSTPNSVSLNWDVPDSKLNGDPLSMGEISGFRVYMSKDNGTYVQIADISKGSSPAFNSPNLSAGEYSFAVVTYDMNGDESPFSNFVETTIL